MKKVAIVRTALLLLPLQVLFRGCEALMPLLLGAWFGRSRSTDVYYFAWALFQLVGSLVFAAYQDSAVLPILTEAKLAGKRQFEAVTGSLLAHTALGGALLSIAAAILAFGSIRVMYGGHELALAARMVPLLSAFLVVLGFRTLFEACLIVEHRYFVSPVARGAGALVMLASVAALHSRVGVLAVAMGTLAGELVAASMLAVALLGRAGFRARPNLSRPEPIRRFARLAASEVAGGAVTRINPVVDQLMATAAGIAGGGTLLRYSLDVALVPTSVLQAVLLPLLLSRFADDIARRDVDGFRAVMLRSLLAVVALLMAASLLMLALRGPLLRLAFLHGHMDRAGVEQMVRLLPYHLLGLAPFGALLVLSRAHVALKNSNIMFSMGVLNAGLNIALNSILVRWMGLEGIALATSIVHLIVAVVFFLRLEPGVRRLNTVAAT